MGMTKALGKALHRPTLFVVPAFILKLRFGEGAGVLTGGQRALPQRLLDAGFDFEFTDIESAMVACVG
jgi:NAD dependent epimerase/dehydratase family enzyme